MEARVIENKKASTLYGVSNNMRHAHNTTLCPERSNPIYLTSVTAGLSSPISKSDTEPSDYSILQKHAYSMRRT